jgi:hypothetical protein
MNQKIHAIVIIPSAVAEISMVLYLLVFPLKNVKSEKTVSNAITGN